MRAKFWDVTLVKKKGGVSAPLCLPREELPSANCNFALYCPCCMESWALWVFYPQRLGDHIVLKKMCKAHGDGRLFDTPMTMGWMKYAPRELLLGELEAEASFQFGDLDYGSQDIEL